MFPIQNVFFPHKFFVCEKPIRRGFITPPEKSFQDFSKNSTVLNGEAASPFKNGLKT